MRDALRTLYKNASSSVAGASSLLVKLGVALCLPAVLMACGAQQAKETLFSEQNHSLLQAQNAKIEAQEERLKILAQEQGSVMQELQDLNQNLGALDRKVTQGIQEQTLIRKSQASAPTIKTAPVENADSDKVFNGKAILGRVEYIWVDSLNQYMKARVDTGAKSSSISASNIQRFERDGERWVKFDVQIDDDVVQTLEAPLHRHVRIRQASMEDLERRPVVELTIQLGEIKETTEFTLSDRNQMLYPVLLGRSFLRDIAVVDVAKKFTRKRDTARIESTKPSKSASR